MPRKFADTSDSENKSRLQPSKLRTRFKVNRFYSTTSSSDNGYVIFDLSWDPKTMEDMSPHNVQQQIISFIKGLESTKEYHDFGVMGRPRIIEMDAGAGVAQVKVRCSETRGVMTLSYTDDTASVPLTGIR